MFISSNTTFGLNDPVADNLDPLSTSIYFHKNNMKGGSDNLNEDTLGSLLKAGIAQYVALEFTKGNGRDNRAINRYLPWLYHPPSAIQSG